MDRPTLSSYIRDHLKDVDKNKEPGPFITLSRQYGCDGYEAADLLAEKLNDLAGEEKWRVFKREILQIVAEDAGLSEEEIDRERQIKPTFIRDFARSVRGSRMPDSYQILKNITTVVRKIAYDGHAIIVGHGATAATTEIENGLNVRIEAPQSWRKKRLCKRDGKTPDEAEKILKEAAVGRKHLDKIYKKTNPRTPAFSLVLDNSIYTDQQMVEHILLSMKQLKLIKD